MGRRDFRLGPKRGRLRDGQIGDKHLSFGLRAQQDSVNEDGQVQDRGEKDRARKGNTIWAVLSLAVAAL
jgi:hypothetical protein